MNDETRKALDKIFATDSRKIQPLGSSMVESIEGETTFLGKFEIGGIALTKLRQLYDDAIAADDAAKLAADAKAKKDKAAKGDEG